MVKNNFKCNYPCSGIKKGIIFPRIEIDPQQIRIVVVSEGPTEKRSDYFYEDASGSFFQTTQIAFQDAGFSINSYDDLTRMGIYLTTAIKCRKLSYLVSAKTIKECSLRFLSQELAQFPNLKVVMCMGDFAIKAVNYIYQEKYGQKPIKPGSTYKIRKEKHAFESIRFLPSYTQTGDSFNLEKSKRQMIAEDIKKALNLLGR